MKKLILLCFIGLATSQAKATTLAPDTTGQALVARLTSAEFCQQLSKTQTTAKIETLKPDEARALLQQTMVAAIGRQPKAIKYLQAPGHNPEHVGIIVMRQLMASCPLAAQLALKTSDTALPAEVAQSASPEQQQVISLIAHDAAGTLVQNTPFDQFIKLTPAQRSELCKEVLQGSMKKHADAISKVYGSSIFFDNERLTVLGGKIGMQLAQEPSCAEYVLQLGRDRTAARAAQ